MRELWMELVVVCFSGAVPLAAAALFLLLRSDRREARHRASHFAHRS